MAESRYEKYIVRKPAIITKDGQEALIGKIVGEGRADTGPLVLCSPNLIPEAEQLFEYGIISGDITVGSGPGTQQRHTNKDHAEMFCFLGTNPKDPSDLGAEVEFWLGEGEEFEKVKITTPSFLYVPPGVAHFPLSWKNVKRPCIFIVLGHGHMGIKRGLKEFASAEEMSNIPVIEPE
jgi:hypothetical protein